MTLPTFLICGGQRCGSTLLWSICKQHPNIFVPDPWFPEPKFFSSTDLYGRGLESYAALFACAGPEHLAIGEKTVTYLHNPEAAPRIARNLPGVKLVFILRDPVTRAFSHYLYSKAHCLETLPFEQALIWEPYRSTRTPAPLQVARPWDYFARGCYARQLAPFFDLFPRERIFVATLEELTGPDGWRVVSSLWKFLSVRQFSARMDASINASAPGESPSAQAVAFLRARYSDANQTLASLLGLRRIWDY
jgi:hypothetical protein